MVHEKLLKIILLSTSIFWWHLAYSSNLACNAGLKLQDYEPNTVALRNDSNDDENIDFKISQMFPVLHNGCSGELSSKPDWYAHPFISFTGEFGFYALGNRDSSPVIGKRFNPKIFLRKWIQDGDGYFDLGYAHESNGQSINTESAYLQKRQEVLARGERVEFANDYLSRGWDYIDFISKTRVADDIVFKKNHIYVNLKYYLSDGVFQGAPEEFYTWETNNGKARKEVDGITVMFKTSNITKNKKSGVKALLKYTTGYESTFDYNTVRLELTYKIKDFPPIIVWGAKGYNTDLADYYKDLTTFGIGLELRNFLDDY